VVLDEIDQKSGDGRPSSSFFGPLKGHSVQQFPDIGGDVDPCGLVPDRSRAGGWCAGSHLE
jgi:hypothetical protein